MKTTKKSMTMKIVSIMLSIIMIAGILPIAVFATEPSDTAEYVYISVSYDDKFKEDKNGKPMAFVPVSFEELEAVDLNDYNLSEYLYDEDGDGTYEITALQLIIYAHEELYGGDFSEVTFTGAPGSSYFEGGLFGQDENLNYYLNGQYPLAGSGWGATSDQIVLEPGDVISLAGFTSWDFYQDSGYGFHYFADGEGNMTHKYTAEAGVACDIKLIKGSKDYEYNSVFFDVPDYTVYYGTELYSETGSVSTDSNACASITFPTAGTWYLWADGGYGVEYPDSIVSAPGYAEVTVTATETEEPREAQDVSEVLDATLAQLAATVTAPAFGTDAGEWTVLSLARGNYYAKDNKYFTDYYDRIVETVNTTAASVNMNGALHKNKSTENSRLIVALSALGKDATAVGDWNLVEAYSANGMDWIKKQGLNGTIWALIALDSNNYATSDATIRQQCVDAILAAQHNDGGWALQANKDYASDPDVTGMALTALYPYRDQEAVASACETAFECLSEMQHENGTFASGGSECAESCAWVIVSCTTWGINPDTDSRFIKNGNSVVDGLLTHYLEDEAKFQHIVGAGSNAMATDQSCYALVAYDRFINNNKALFDYSDVTFSASTYNYSATLGLPENVENIDGAIFNGVVSINGWDNEAGYKLIDMVVSVPAGVSVTNVTAGDRLEGGALSYNLADGKLRVVYFDSNENSDITVEGTSFPTALFNITFGVPSAMGGKLDISVDEMSIKSSSDSSDSDSIEKINLNNAKGNVTVTEQEAEPTFSAGVLYTGDGVDLIPASKKAVAVSATNLAGTNKLIYNDGTNTIELKYSTDISEKLGVATYIALVDSAIAIADFENADYYTVGDTSDSVTFGDINGDGVINAQDALAAVDMWLRKGDAPTDGDILTANVNGDGRIDTYDALGIVEAFVYGDSEYAVVTKATTIFN
ncbi:MAG: hypothetical protein IJW79_06755 [Clostridia bacterium]|nr:hypothetical protein [Clostridia bacterium]